MEPPVIFPQSFRCYKPLNHKVYGTICITPYNRILLVKGRKTGKWSFPKGHKKRSETYINCALRETEEETGISLYDKCHTAYHKLSAGEYYIFEVEKELEIDIRDTCEIEEALWIHLLDIPQLPCNVDVNRFLDKIDRGLRH